MRKQCEREAEGQVRTLHPESEEESWADGWPPEAEIRREIPSLALRESKQQDGVDEFARILGQAEYAGKFAINDLCWWSEEPVPLRPVRE